MADWKKFHILIFFLRQLHPHQYIWRYSETRNANPKKVSRLPTSSQTTFFWSSPSLNHVWFYPSLSRKVNSFLDKMNPTEEQMASYINTMREKQWPEVPHAAPSAPRTEEEKNESRERAHNLISSKCRAPICCSVGFFSFLQILSSVTTASMTFLPVCRFQLPCPKEDWYGVCLQPVPGTGRKQNTGICEYLGTWSLPPFACFLALIFIVDFQMLLSLLLREFLPNEHSLSLSAAALQKVTNSSS